MTTKTVATTTAQTGIEQTTRHFEEAMRRGNPVDMVQVYTEQARVLPPNGETVTGKPAILAFWQRVMEMGIKEIEMEMEELEVYGDTAWEVGRAVLRAAGGQVADRVKYIVIWKEDNGRWLKHRGTWNSNAPA
jgi:uncharacterized protein (TIGR02246 family)